MFDHFRLDHVNLGEVTLRVRYGGAGAPVVLLYTAPLGSRGAETLALLNVLGFQNVDAGKML
jgi:hypothetical protein